jgi:hypothetical protein
MRKTILARTALTTGGTSRCSFGPLRLINNFKNELKKEIKKFNNHIKDPNSKSLTELTLPILGKNKREACGARKQTDIQPTNQQCETFRGAAPAAAAATHALHNPIPTLAAALRLVPLYR